MKNSCVKRFMLIISVVMFFSICNFAVSSAYLIDEAPQSGAVITVNAEDKEPAAAGGGQSEKSSAEGTAATTEGASTKDDSTEGKTRSGKGTLMIVISCIVSLAIAIFLAVRKANKVYGKGWD